MTRRQSILFLIDTQGANCVGCYQPGLALGTPHIDRLAAGCVRFDRAYSCSPVCGPARSAIFTGLYPHSTGVLANDLAPHQGLPSIGQRLRDAGIATGYIGKWHLDGSDYFGDGRCPDGWDPEYWMDGRNYLASLPDDAARDLSRRELPPAEIAAHRVTAEFTHAWRIAERARDFIHRHRDRDFFLVVSIDEPHHPSICPEPFASAFEDFLFPVPNADDPLTGKPPSQSEWAQLCAPKQAKLVRRDGRAFLHHPLHFGCNSFVDAQVGRVLAAAEEHASGAQIVYTSDHGDMFGSHRLHGKGPCMYDEVTRIPLIIRWPGETAAGAVSAPPVSHIDLVPTLLDYFGVPLPALLQGKSLRAACRSPEQRTHDFVFSEFNRFEVDHDGFGAFAPIRCAFDGRYKLAVNLLESDEFYDRHDDPLELRNRIGDPAVAAIRDRLHDALLAWMNTRDPLRGPHWGRRSWRQIEASTWSGPTRPRPADPAYYPPTLLYETGRPVDRAEYPKQ